MKRGLSTEILAATLVLPGLSSTAWAGSSGDCGCSNARLMRRSLFKRQAQSVALLLGIGFLSGPAFAGDLVKKCSLATLRGQYLTSDTGTVFPPAFGVTEPAVSNTAAYVIFNGDGTGTDYVTFTINGKNANVTSPVPETYTLKPDCTGTRQVTNGPQFNIYVAFDGSAFATIATSPGFAVSTTYQRIDTDR